jgi:hypothetical protein
MGLQLSRQVSACGVEGVRAADMANQVQRHVRKWRQGGKYGVPHHLRQYHYDGCKVRTWLCIQCYKMQLTSIATLPKWKFGDVQSARNTLWST